MGRRNCVSRQPKIYRRRTCFPVERQQCCSVDYAITDARSRSTSSKGGRYSTGTHHPHRRCPRSRDSSQAFHGHMWCPALRSTGETSVTPKKDPAYLMYSSGTTGYPKGALLSHHNIVSNVLQTDAVEGRHLTYNGGEDGRVDRVLIFLPLFHIYGKDI